MTDDNLRHREKILPTEKANSLDVADGTEVLDVVEVNLYVKNGSTLTITVNIMHLFQTVLDASITDVDFSVRVQAYEQAPSLQKQDRRTYPWCKENLQW